MASGLHESSGQDLNTFLDEASGMASRQPSGAAAAPPPPPPPPPWKRRTPKINQAKESAVSANGTRKNKSGSQKNAAQRS